MSKAEILTELPKLSAKERREILDLLLQLEEEGWLDEADLTDDERKLIEARFEAHQQNPNAAIPWD